MTVTSDTKQMKRLLNVGRTLIAEHTTDAVLDKILEEARAITGARYAALGVLDESRAELERFITAGVDPQTHRAIGDLPSGRGVLGVLIENPRPLRLSDVGEHPRSYGFPLGHPQMRTFLGVPIVIRDQAWGNLYLTEKEGGGPFTDEDEEAAVLLARWAATAIENARLHETSERRSAQLEQAVRSLEAARDITEAISGVSELERILELIVKRGRALVEARSVVIMLREGDFLVVAASAGHADHARGHRLPVSGSTSGQVLERGTPERVLDVETQLRIAPAELGVPDARCGLLVPMIHRGARVGVLAAFDRGIAGEAFTAEDERLLRNFGSAAANAVAVHQSVAAERLRTAMSAAEDERSRWARELHDQTLQSLGGLRVLLAATVGRGDAAAKDDAIRQAVEDIELEIANLRGIISDLRPSLLDDLGLKPALDALLDRRRGDGLEIASRIAVSEETVIAPELETTIYRLVQESLTNVVKHAGASQVRVFVGTDGNHLVVEVEDDGAGFDAEQGTAGFGLAGMRERVYLAGGELEIEPRAPGTLVRATLPVTAVGQGGSADQIAS